MKNLDNAKAILDSVQPKVDSHGNQTSDQHNNSSVPAESSLLLRRPNWDFSKDQGLSAPQVFAKLCKEENLAAMFCAPGNYDITHAMAEEGIPSYGGRTEGGMCSAADGFYRASGEVAACSGTEGPGLANMMMGIAAGWGARTPMLILASNCTTTHEDRDFEIQNLPQQSMTEGLRKYGKRIIVPERIYEYGAHAFRHLKTGIPGPVHLDFTEEVCQAKFKDPSELTDFWSKHLYRSQSVAAPHSQDIDSVVHLIENAKRPMIVAGHGVFHRNACDALKQTAEKNDIAVAISGPNRGHFPDEHPLAMSLSPDTVGKADLVIFIGQYCMPSPREYTTSDSAKTIRVHTSGEDLGRNWPVDLGVVGDERLFLEMLADALPQRKRSDWVDEIKSGRDRYEQELERDYEIGLGYSRENAVHPAVIGKELYEFFFNGDIDPRQTVMGSGGFTHQRYIPPRFRAYRPGQTITTLYQMGALGTAIPMMIGATAAIKQGVGYQKEFKGAPTVVQCGDSELGYSLLELETAVMYKLPLIVIVYNNNSWGTWFDANSSEAMQLHLMRENTRYDIMAEQMGVHGEYVNKPEKMASALRRCYEIAARESRPCLINVQAIREFSCSKLYPPGYTRVPEPGIASYQH
ncbi:Sulfoacetaldehyde acetyltransferase [Pseudoalteromonas holothuriae]|uniref:Sulfoacetaldehyde acetyltransferase n=1 Tax=Pseudoalteromonas holothuriae TaxID=2963714 RepID=A0ABN8UQ87_9GAMM|nr:thiamine pyrophosphate-binding protein [Pseudoalteromonas sp. CIP111951]CAH9059411.1 Sulfoacetaldehyde acetyltransferase [Pseudoalteromonas sp. CIP111951]